MGDALAGTGRRARAARRRAGGYPGAIVRLGTPKPVLHAGASAAERLERMAALCRSLWLVSGPMPEPGRRDEMHGEVFVLDRR